MNFSEMYQLRKEAREELFKQKAIIEKITKIIKTEVENDVRMEIENKCVKVNNLIYEFCQIKTSQYRGRIRIIIMFSEKYASGTRKKRLEEIKKSGVLWSNHKIPLFISMDWEISLKKYCENEYIEINPTNGTKWIKQ